LIRLLDAVDDVFVFPHMGDGGLAVGAAALATAAVSGRPARLDLQGMRLGPEFSDDEMRSALTRAGLRCTRPESRGDAVADLIAADRVVMWFDGRMELGPRALGGRSVLARPDRADISRRLNLALKRRVWYQPFCPSLLESDARDLFEDWKGLPDRYMTMAYRVRDEHRPAVAGVTSVDGTCRPQIVADDEPGAFAALLRALRSRLGRSVVLNTSFNIHGEPLVCTPAEAVDTFVRSGADALQLGPFLACRG
jgi:carbamoyltransferase